MKWLNEPKQWTEQGDVVKLNADQNTDFWRLTHDGLVRNNGHFYYQEIEEDFICEVTLEGSYHGLYDHAGLMLRLDDTTWLKCGVEFVDGIQQASVVVTRDFSDWSVVTMNDNPKSIRLRLERDKGTVTTSYALENEDYTMLRQSYLTEAYALQMGMMCAAPKGEGFPVTFRGFNIRAIKSLS